MVAYGHAVDNESEELNALYDEFTELVNKADAITDDLDARYEAYADAEALLIEHALTLPSNFDIGWELTHINDYNKQNAMFGIQNLKYKNCKLSTNYLYNRDTALNSSRRTKVKSQQLPIIACQLCKGTI